jgi:diketogulonate reductase-like aldo/keto reductase
MWFESVTVCTTTQLPCPERNHVRLTLPKTVNPAHAATNAAVDFEISEADTQTLRVLDEKDHGDSSVFPVHSGR